jgi:hypothetical protein
MPFVYSAEYLWELAFPNIFLAMKAYPGLYEDASVQMDSTESTEGAGLDILQSSGPTTSSTAAASRWWHIGTRAFAAAFRNPSIYRFNRADFEVSRSSLKFLDSYGLHDVKLWRCAAALTSTCYSPGSRVPAMLGSSHDALSFLQLVTNVMVST